MGVISAFWRTYSTKIKFVLISIVLLLIVGGYFYVKQLHSDISKIESENARLVLDLDQSEAEKMLLLKKVYESTEKISGLDVQISKHASDARNAKRSLEDLKSEYEKLLISDPSAASTILTTEYNKFVYQLSCASGGGECE